eukprot:m.13192 g.13192  ORF g.13192 m.13192 type:complete len:445 (-) comp5912_c0_seq1:841-2175(-)
MAGWHAHELQLESFEHGSRVVLQYKSQYLSCATDPESHSTPVELCVRKHAHAWEVFHLHRHEDDETVSLRHMGGGFVSPRSTSVGEAWISRGHCPAGGWERLHMTVLEHDEDGLARSVLLYLIDTDGRQLFLELAEDQRVVVGLRGSPWQLQLAAPPALNIAGLQLAKHGSVWETLQSLDDDVGAHNPRVRTFVLRVLRAMRTLGAFYVVAHGLPADLFHTCQQAYKPLPYQSEAERDDDASRKVNHRVYDTREGMGVEARERVAGSVGVSPGVFEAMAQQYFEQAERLVNGLLHVMALGQATAQHVPASDIAWRGAWRDEHAYIGLRILAYHPGPSADASGAPILSTARHTDATWATLLWNDDIDGLHIRTVAGDMAVVPPVAGALLMNAGNVLQRASAGFFDAVCHWVVRTAATERSTRVSMPFFYDRSDDGRFWGGGTGTC